MVEIYAHGKIDPSSAVPTWVLIAGGVGIGESPQRMVPCGTRPQSGRLIVWGRGLSPIIDVFAIDRRGSLSIASHMVLLPGCPPCDRRCFTTVIGLATYGHKVMATVGQKIATLTFARGYAAQIGTALTVLTATQLGVSVSTTHCLIGAISGVALVEGRDKLNSGTLKRIVVSWVVTIPAAALFSVALYGILALLF